MSILNGILNEGASNLVFGGSIRSKSAVTPVALHSLSTCWLQLCSCMKRETRLMAHADPCSWNSLKRSAWQGLQIFLDYLWLVDCKQNRAIHESLLF